MAVAPPAPLQPVQEPPVGAPPAKRGLNSDQRSRLLTLVDDIMRSPAEETSSTSDAFADLMRRLDAANELRRNILSGRYATLGLTGAALPEDNHDL